MLNYRVFIPMVFEEEAHLESVIGTHILENGGQVDIAATGTQIGEVCTMAFEGTLPDILAVVMKEWEDDDLAVEALAQAFVEGHAEPM